MNQGKDNQNQEADFVSFYLEQESQSSNVYYAVARRNDGAQRKASFGRLVSKRTGLRIAASLAALFIVAVLAGVFSFISNEKTRLSNERERLVKSGFEEILSAQKALSELRLNESFFSFNSAHQRFRSALPSARYFSARVLGAAQYWPLNLFINEDDGAGLGFESELARAGAEAAHSAGLILKGARTKNLSDFSGGIEGLKNVQKNLKNTKEKIEASGDVLSASAVSWLADVIDRFDGIISKSDLVLWAAGIDRPRTFLVVAQNTGQARATGGAIISAGIVTVENGAVTGISFDDVYNIDGQLQTKVIPPKPIQRIDTVWSLHNANWFFDFPTSAQKIAYFYQKSQGVRPDGVIAVSEKTFADFLEITGPIELLKYDLTVDKDNFNHLTSFNAMSEKNANQAKRVFNDFASVLLNKLISMPEDSWSNIFDLAGRGAARKDILVWLNNEKYERVVSEDGWGGGVPEAAGRDYFAFVATDMGGAGDGVSVRQSIIRESEITDNEIISTVRVERKYEGNGLAEAPSSSVPEYWRLYVPPGSELISVSGFTLPKDSIPIKYSDSEFKADSDVVLSEKMMRVDSDAGAQIFQESGKNVFGGWVGVSYEYPTQVAFKYKSPILSGERGQINFMLQKQPGAESELDFKIFRPGESDPISLYKGIFSQDLYLDASQ